MNSINFFTLDLRNFHLFDPEGAIKKSTSDPVRQHVIFFFHRDRGEVRSLDQSFSERPREQTRRRVGCSRMQSLKDFKFGAKRKFQTVSMQTSIPVQDSPFVYFERSYHSAFYLFVVEVLGSIFFVRGLSVRSSLRRQRCFERGSKQG